MTYWEIGIGFIGAALFIRFWIFGDIARELSRIANALDALEESVRNPDKGGK